MKEKIIVKPYATPCGIIVLGSTGEKLCLCEWPGVDSAGCTDIGRMLRAHSITVMARRLKAEFEEGTSAVIEKAAGQLDEYFDGRRTVFDLPIVFAGTDFQRMVWSEIAKIPYGHTISYGELARRIGRPSSVRAVANATGANVISVIVPCHRVIGSDNSLTGYAGGLKAKEYLLKSEGILLC